jgi:hypothetical protein
MYGQFLVGALGVAASGDKILARALLCGQLPQHSQGLLAGHVDEPAGVDNQKVCVVRPIRGDIAGCSQQSGDALAIDEVLGTAQRNEVKPAWSGDGEELP